MRVIPESDEPGAGRPLRIAMIGQRGLPATYGGIEHHVAHLGARLAARGHEVTVFCRSNYAPARSATFDGMRLRHLPTVGTKHLDAIVHSLLSTIAATSASPDIVHYHALGPGLCSPLPRYLSRAKVVQTIHGLDDRRAKWGKMAKGVLRTARWASDRVPDAVIAVSREVAEEYERTRRGLTVHVPNGVAAPKPPSSSGVLERLGLRPGRYVLFVGRLVPEKAPDLLIEAFRGLPEDVALVVAGGSSYTGEYVERLRAIASAVPRVRMPGYVYGDDLAALYTGAAVFVQPSHLEGMPLTLLEAVSYGMPVVASGIAPHREVLGEDAPGARFFRTGDAGHLRAVLGDVLAHEDRERQGADRRRTDVLRRFSWDTAADETERLYYRLLGRRAAPHAAGDPSARISPEAMAGR